MSKSIQTAKDSARPPSILPLMSSDESFGRLRVQTVLFGQAQEQLWRLLQGLSAAARKVQDAGLVTSVDWALGDSSSEPVFG
ncbi:MAG TPA: hypothetical protein VK672_02520, partial [Solirubrobacteraceae bacterium]|nr:hypothetical protein [Solirubrobacteraceae bacterium]